MMPTVAEELCRIAVIAKPVRIAANGLVRDDRNSMIFGDSFTNALETLLYASFNETRVLDLRQYDEMSLRDYIGQYRPDVVLCVQNDTFYYLSGGNNDVWEEP